MRRVLLLGYGNPGRLDDGLGPALAASIEALALSGVTVDADYQLMVEDAVSLRDVEVVIFVDAALSGPAPFSISSLEPGSRKLGFSSHSVDPLGLLALARDLFDAIPEAYLVGIRGYEFDAFGEGLSAKAQENLEATQAFLVDVLRRDDLEALSRAGRVGIME